METNRLPTPFLRNWLRDQLAQALAKELNLPNKTVSSFYQFIPLLIETPSPDTYRQLTNIDLEFQRSSAYYKGKKKSFCFGAGREDFKKSCFNETHIKSLQKYPDEIVPGPGNYADETRNIGVNARKWSLQGKNIYLDDTSRALKLNLPGPGTYNDKQAMPATGSYPSSEYQNSKSSRMNTGRRFKNTVSNRNPGPGQYEESGKVSLGIHTCSSFKSPMIKNIGTTEQRPAWSVHNRFATPGPGTYRPPSDFGYLELNKGKEFNTSTIGGNVSTTEGTSRWDNRLNVQYMSTMAHSEFKSNKPFNEKSFGEPSSGTLRMKNSLISPKGVSPRSKPGSDMMGKSGLMTPKDRHSDWNFNQAQSPAEANEHHPTLRQKRGRKGQRNGSPTSNIKDIMGIYADVKQ